MVKDERDIIASTVTHMASQVDGLLIADNQSTDGTREVLKEVTALLDIPVVLVDDTQVAYQQSRKMTRLARLARESFNAQWIVPFDADEIWQAHGDWRVKDVLEEAHPSQQVVEAALFDYVASALDPDHPNPVVRIKWRRRHPAPLPKVACRWHKDLIIEMGNHSVNYGGFVPDRVDPQLVIAHFPYRSPEQVISKIRNGSQAYAATSLPDHFGAHWRGWGRILDEQGEDAIVDLFHKWHWREDPDSFHVIDGESQPPLLRDPVKNER